MGNWLQPALGVGALLLHREGYKIVSLSDMYGCIHNEKGLDVPAVLAWLQSKGHFAEIEESREEAAE